MDRPPPDTASELSSKDLLSPQEFASFTGMSLATVHRYLKAGTLPKIQVGGKRHRVLIPLNALQHVTAGCDKKPVFETSDSPKPETPTAKAPRRGRPPRWLSKSLK